MNYSYKTNLLAEGKTKKIYNTKNTSEVIIHYKDNITAFNGKKNELIKYKGILNNKISAIIFEYLNNYGITTHFIRKINDREQLCYNINVFPIEFIVRNIITGSMSKKLGIQEGITPKNVILETCYKNDSLNDPMINDHHIVFLNIVSYSELKKIYSVINIINNVLKKFFLCKNIILVDFKLEFGKNKSNEIVLSDEISPDTCRLWDTTTMKKLDKDIFRKEKCIEKTKIYNIYMNILKRFSKKNKL